MAVHDRIISGKNPLDYAEILKSIKDAGIKEMEKKFNDSNESKNYQLKVKPKIVEVAAAIIASDDKRFASVSGNDLALRLREEMFVTDARQNINKLDDISKSVISTMFKTAKNLGLEVDPQQIKGK